MIASSILQFQEKEKLKGEKKTFKKRRDTEELINIQ